MIHLNSERKTKCYDSASNKQHALLSLWYLSNSLVPTVGWILLINISNCKSWDGYTCEGVGPEKQLVGSSNCQIALGLYLYILKHMSHLFHQLV